MATCSALSNVSLDVPAGMFGLLGPNGAGKSSLMRTIATLQDPDAGSITFDGVDVVANKDQIRRTLGYLPQDFGVYPKVERAGHARTLRGAQGIRPHVESARTSSKASCAR